MLAYRDLRSVAAMVWPIVLWSFVCPVLAQEQEADRVKDPPALVCTAEATTVRELKACRRADPLRDDSAHRALYLLRLYELSPSKQVGNDILDSMPTQPEGLWHIYDLTDLDAAQDHPALGGAPYAYFTLLGRLVVMRGTHIAQYLALCCYSDGEVADFFWDWVDEIRSRWPQEFQKALDQLDPSCRERATAAHDS